MTDAPKPGPVTPIRAVPVRDDNPRLNDDGAESRRRIVHGLLPYIKDPDDLLMVAAWIAYRQETT